MRLRVEIAKTSIISCARPPGALRHVVVQSHTHTHTRCVVLQLHTGHAELTAAQAREHGQVGWPLHDPMATAACLANACTPHSTVRMGVPALVCLPQPKRASPCRGSVQAAGAMYPGVPTPPRTAFDPPTTMNVECQRPAPQRPFALWWRCGRMWTGLTPRRNTPLKLRTVQIVLCCTGCTVATHTIHTLGTYGQCTEEIGLGAVRATLEV